MEPNLLTARAAAGDLDSFGQLYDLYFGRVYDLAWRILRDADAAGVITRDVFESARAGLHSMVGADFGAWVLLAAARAALARAEQTSAATPQVLHEEAFGSFDAPDPCRLNDPKLTAGDHALACTVWEAATTLGARDYASLDLGLRQHLEAPAIAPILGVTKGNAPPALERLAHAADEAMLTYVLARRGGAACEPLRTVLAEAGFPPYDDAIRQAVDTHAASCTTCRATRVLPSRPTAILAGLMPGQAPFVLKSETWRALVAAWPAAGVTAGAAALEAATRFARSSPSTGAVPAATTAATTSALALDPAFDGGGGGFDGMPGAAGGFGDDGNRNIIWFAAAAIGMIVVAFLIGGIAVGAFGLGGGGNGGASAAATHTSTPAAADTPEQIPTPGVHVDSPTPAPSPSPSPAVTDTPAPAATPTPAPQPTPIRAASATPTRIIVPTPIVATPTPPRQPTPGGPPTPTPTGGAVAPGPTPIVP